MIFFIKICWNLTLSVIFNDKIVQLKCGRTKAIVRMTKGMYIFLFFCLEVEKLQQNIKLNIFFLLFSLHSYKQTIKIPQNLTYLLKINKMN